MVEKEWVPNNVLDSITRAIRAIASERSIAVPLSSTDSTCPTRRSTAGSTRSSTPIYSRSTDASVRELEWSVPGLRDTGEYHRHRHHKWVHQELDPCAEPLSSNRRLYFAS